MTVVDPSPGTANALAITTANVRVERQGGVLLSATERVAVAAGTVVANFTDGNLADLASGLTATIDWGDGTTSEGHDRRDRTDRSRFKAADTPTPMKASSR